MGLKAWHDEVCRGLVMDGIIDDDGGGFFLGGLAVTSFYYREGDGD